ncbi:hypothetical protein DRO35_01910 [Candidatus Bathyarchaeota archaeon]|nr:MAG: hypothetical protein CW706_01225 [Candidatus Bathyarchaeota archaeon]RLI12879.1 MAG: hypothetical protein DRO35_01910 [Candidatus Bathyarchaeota archaeon]
MGYLRIKHSAIIKLELPSVREAQIFFEALKPETMSPATPRSHVRIERRNSLLLLFFEASDTTALRASLNSYLSWLHLLKSVIDALKEYE